MSYKYLYFGAAVLGGFITMLHAVLVWREGNRYGAFGVLLLAFANLALPFYLAFLHPLAY